ncbi:MAG: serine hydrolase domain-containing protein [Hyphomonadaceae bacterium]
MAAISARQLAAHTSGLPHYQDIDADRGDVHFDSVHDSLAVFADRELLFAPGSGYNYSSFGFTLLSAYIEARAGQPFLDYLANEITTGLDIEADRGPRPSATVAYEFVSDHAEAAPPHDYSYSWGGAGLRGSAPDLARFGLRVLDSAFLSRAARDAMFTPATLDNDAVAGERDFAVGIGWRVGRDHDGHPISHHAGIAVGARSVLVVFPGSDASIAVLSNAAWSASIEQTALMLAAPFREGVTGPATPCPTETVSFDGVFDETPIQGAAGFELDQGLCRGWIAAENAFGVWLNALPQGNAARLPIISVAASRSLERAALVTPAGIYDLRRTADGYAAAIGSSRRLTLQLRPATGRRATEPSEP